MSRRFGSFARGNLFVAASYVRRASARNVSTYVRSSSTQLTLDHNQHNERAKQKINTTNRRFLGGGGVRGFYFARCYCVYCHEPSFRSFIIFRYRKELVQLFRRYCNSVSPDGERFKYVNVMLMSDSGIWRFVGEFPVLARWAQGDSILRLIIR